MDIIIIMQVHQFSEEGKLYITGQGCIPINSQYGYIIVNQFNHGSLHDDFFMQVECRTCRSYYNAYDYRLSRHGNEPTDEGRVQEPPRPAVANIEDNLGNCPLYVSYSNY